MLLRIGNLCRIDQSVLVLRSQMGILVVAGRFGQLPIDAWRVALCRLLPLCCLLRGSVDFLVRTEIPSMLMEHANAHCYDHTMIILCPFFMHILVIILS